MEIIGKSSNRHNDEFYMSCTCWYTWCYLVPQWFNLILAAYTWFACNQHTPWFQPKIEQIYTMALDSEVPWIVPWCLFIYSFIYFLVQKYKKLKIKYKKDMQLLEYECGNAWKMSTVQRLKFDEKCDKDFQKKSCKCCMTNHCPMPLNHCPCWEFT